MYYSLYVGQLKVFRSALNFKVNISMIARFRAVGPGLGNVTGTITTTQVKLDNIETNLSLDYDNIA